MNPTSLPAPISVPTSTSGSTTILDRPETEMARPETVLQARPTGMVLHSQRHAGRSEVVISAEIHPERSLVAPRPEQEIARPEIEFAPVASSSSDPPAVASLVYL